MDRYLKAKRRRCLSRPAFQVWLAAACLDCCMSTPRTSTPKLPMLKPLLCLADQVTEQMALRRDGEIIIGVILVKLLKFLQTLLTEYVEVER
jgi:hypothetical protein